MFSFVVAIRHRSSSGRHIFTSNTGTVATAEQFAGAAPRQESIKGIEARVYPRHVPQLVAAPAPSYGDGNLLQQYLYVLYIRYEVPVIFIRIVES